MARGHLHHLPQRPWCLSPFDLTENQYDRLPVDAQRKVLALAISQVSSKQYQHWIMEYWNSQTHGLPNLPPLSHGVRNLAATPPMPLPLVDQHLPMLDPPLAASYGVGHCSLDGAPNWISGSSGSGSSPFRQQNSGYQGLQHPDTVSPEQLHPQLPHALMSPGQDDMGVFSFSDSDGPLSGPHFAQPLIAVPSDRRYRQIFPGRRDSSGQCLGVDDAQQVKNEVPSRNFHQQSRHPLPSGPRQVRHSDVEYAGSHQLQHAEDGPEASHKPRPPTVLRSSASVPRKDHGTNKKGAHPRRPGAAPGSTKGNKALAPRGSVPPPAARQSGVATERQGNRWPIDRLVMEKIVATERNLDGKRPRDLKLSYKQIKAKYSRWEVSESTLRGIKRNYDLPKEHRERKPTWDDLHVQALRRAIPRCTNRKGHIAWAQIVERIRRDTGKPFGAGTVRKKWEDLVRNGLDQQAQGPGGGGEREREGDVEDEDMEDSSSDVFESFLVSDDEPGFAVSFDQDQGGGGDNDGPPGAGRVALGERSMPWAQTY